MKIKISVFISTLAIAVLGISGCGDDSTTDNTNNTYVSETVTFNSLSYKTVKSPYTGKIWLDRNLGATQACVTLEDTACFGDYYQWGRSFDGHQSKTSTTTSTRAADINNAGIFFIMNSAYDWATTDSDGSLRSFNWSKIDDSLVCPIGFRVPTIDELSADTTYDMENNFLKLPCAGYRDNDNAGIYDAGTYGHVWSSTLDSEISNARKLGFHPGGVTTFRSVFSKAISVRCIQD